MNLNFRVVSPGGIIGYGYAEEIIIPSNNGHFMLFNYHAYLLTALDVELTQVRTCDEWSAISPVKDIARVDQSDAKGRLQTIIKLSKNALKIICWAGLLTSPEMKMFFIADFYLKIYINLELKDRLQAPVKFLRTGATIICLRNLISPEIKIFCILGLYGNIFANVGLVTLLVLRLFGFRVLSVRYFRVSNLDDKTLAD